MIFPITKKIVVEYKKNNSNPFLTRTKMNQEERKELLFNFTSFCFPSYRSLAHWKIYKFPILYETKKAKIDTK